jgi:hypothetical protein
MKKAKIAKITGASGFESKFGPMFNIKVELDNGDKGQIVAKDQNKYKEGEEIEYTLEAKEYNGNTYYTIKVQQAQKGFGGKSYVADIDEKFVGFAFSYVKDFVVAGTIDKTHYRSMAREVALEMKKVYKEMKASE